MAREPGAGSVKTRLSSAGGFSPQVAAVIAEAMLRCTAHRLLACGRLVLAVTPDGRGEDLARRLGVAPEETLDQGPGDLGQRLGAVWERLSRRGPVAFFGGDSPDVPVEVLAGIPEALAGADVAAGPTPDGGYWTLAASRHLPAVLARIDWGTPRVYDQTRRRAAEGGLVFRALPAWPDVDRPEDVEALRVRLRQLPGPSASVLTGDSPLRHLAERLGTLSMTLARRTGRTTASPDPARRADNTDACRADKARPHMTITKPRASGERPAAGTDPDLADLADATILLVDDNVQNLELMQAYLEGLPCRIATARDGVEAHDLITRDPPDLVLLDVMMPRMSGFELCQKIKSAPATRDVVVIMVTALHEVGDYERAVECGTDDFLTKPVNKLELLTRVRSLLRVRLLKRLLDQVMSLRHRVAPDERDRPEAGHKLE